MVLRKAPALVVVNARTATAKAHIASGKWLPAPERLRTHHSEVLLGQGRAERSQSVHGAHNV